MIVAELYNKDEEMHLYNKFTTLKHARNGGFSLCHYSHSIVAGGLLEIS